MRHFTAADVDAALDFPSLIDTLAEAFRGGFHAPQRHHHEIDRPGEPNATALLMPAWTAPGGDAGDFLGTKIVNVYPGNSARGLPAVLGLYALQSGLSGAPLATIEGTRLTLWRTAAASALAARYLAPTEAKRLLLVGAGSLAPFLARAHRSQRPIETVAVWNHRLQGAERLAESLRHEGFDAHAAPHLEEAVRKADVISCATLSQTPLVAGAWLRPGQHLDLVGAFNMHMREADDAALKRARVFVDTSAALNEGGDVALGLKSGALTPTDIVGDLAALVHGAPGRTALHEVTLFKSVGAAIEDLAAAILVWKKAGGEG
ncbi:MAG TPA: ornithine cyclodeaminase family protein [Roseiarcus sp.]|jgi:ornithine cyclodeaminase